MKNRLIPLLVLVFGGASLSYQVLSDTIPQEKWVVPEEYKNMKNPYAGDADDDQIGLEIYSQYCASCHGTRGKGDGPNAGLIEVPVADFSDEAFKSQSDGSLLYKLIKGRGVMPAFESIITYEEDRWLLVNYIKQF